MTVGSQHPTVTNHYQPEKEVNMAQGILANSPSKLNLSRRQTALFQKTILTGSRMAEVLKDLESQAVLPKRASKLASGWTGLMVELVDLLL